MDCLQARFLGMLARRAGPEIEPDDREAFEQHVRACADCQAWDEQEIAFEERVSTVLRAVPVPVGLQQRVLDKVLQKTRPRPWMWLTTAVALLLAVGIGSLVWWGLRSHPLDPMTIYQEWQRGGDRDQLQSWLKQHGYHTLPDHLHFDYLQSYEMAEIAGRRVPRITYFYPGGQRHRAVLAHVFIFEEGDMTSLGEAMGHNIKTTHQPPYIFLTISTGGSLAPLEKGSI